MRTIVTRLWWIACGTPAPSQWHVTRCIDRLAETFFAEVRTLADDLCACTDRACYDALAPRISRVFSEENVANVGPEMVERLTVEFQRFNRCDARFTTGPEQP